MDFESVVKDLLGPDALDDLLGNDEGVGDAPSRVGAIAAPPPANGKPRNGASPPSRETATPPRRSLAPEKLFQAGVALVKRQQPREAVLVFEKALELDPENPDLLSWCGLSLAQARLRGAEAIRMCETAVEGVCLEPVRYLNLGRAYLLSGQRGRAWKAFHQGLTLDGSHEELRACVSSMGVRRRPFFPFLPRGHRANQVAGRTLARLGLG